MPGQNTDHSLPPAPVARRRANPRALRKQKIGGGYSTADSPALVTVEHTLGDANDARLNQLVIVWESWSYSAYSGIATALRTAAPNFRVLLCASSRAPGVLPSRAQPWFGTRGAMPLCCDRRTSAFLAFNVRYSDRRWTAWGSGTVDRSSAMTGRSPSDTCPPHLDSGDAASTVTLLSQ